MIFSWHMLLLTILCPGDGRTSRRLSDGIQISFLNNFDQCCAVSNKSVRLNRVVPNWQINLSVYGQLFAYFPYLKYDVNGFFSLKCRHEKHCFYTNSICMDLTTFAKRTGIDILQIFKNFRRTPGVRARVRCFPALPAVDMPCIAFGNDPTNQYSRRKPYVDQVAAGTQIYNPNSYRCQMNECTTYNKNESHTYILRFMKFNELSTAQCRVLVSGS